MSAALKLKKKKIRISRQLCSLVVKVLPGRHVLHIGVSLVKFWIDSSRWQVVAQSHATHMGDSD